MVKRVKVEQLKPGMFISDLNCGWLRHPFITNNMKLKKDATIEKIIGYGIREIYIDTDKGLHVADAPTEKDVHQEIQRKINKVIEIEKENTDRPWALLMCMMRLHLTGVINKDRTYPCLKKAT